MQLKQFEYIIAIAEQGSINAAAKSLYISQSSLSVAVRDLERELGIVIFTRTPKGVTLTNDGVELLSYARQVTEQVKLVEERFLSTRNACLSKLSVSTQHYAFAVRAFEAYLAERGDDPYEYALRETKTAEVIEDVRSFHSEVGILYLSAYNETVLRRRFDENNIVFVPLFITGLHVFVREGHPLAERASVTPEDLTVWPRYSFEQGEESSLFYCEEPVAQVPGKQHITATDRATLTSLLRTCDGYLVASGVLMPGVHDGIVSVPLETDEVMTVGYVYRDDRMMSDEAAAYIRHLEAYVSTLSGDVRPVEA